jgi:hypothetical protein
MDAFPFLDLTIVIYTGASFLRAVVVFSQDSRVHYSTKIGSLNPNIL